MLCLHSAIIRYYPAQWTIVLCPVSLPELWLHSPSHRAGRKLTFPWAQSTLNPQVDTLAQRGRMGEKQTRPGKAGGVEGGGHRRKLGLGHSQLPAGPCNPAEPSSVGILVHNRGDISCGRGYCQAKGRPGECGLTVLPSAQG